MRIETKRILENGGGVGSGKKSETNGIYQAEGEIVIGSLSLTQPGLFQRIGV